MMLSVAVPDQDARNERLANLASDGEHTSRLFVGGLQAFVGWHSEHSHSTE
jgi:hypothetical protein